MKRIVIFGVIVAFFLVFLPVFPVLAQDGDSDGMPDSYEAMYGCLMANTVDSDIDYDSDGLTSLTEYQYSEGLNPCAADTDADGVNDGYEIYAGSNPISNTITPGAVPLPSESRITVTPASYPSLAWSGSEYGMAWQDGGPEVNFGRFSAPGDTVGSNLRITYNPQDSLTPWMAWSGSEYGVAWEDFQDGNYEIYFAHFSQSGTQMGSNLRVTANSFNSRYAFLVWTGTEYGLTWSDDRDGNYEIYFARVSAAGTKVGSDIRISNMIGSSTAPALAVNGSEYGLTWSDNNVGNGEIYFCRLNRAGTKIGGDVRLTNDAATSGTPFAVHANSQYVIVWNDARDGNEEIYFARVSDTGTKMGGDVRISAGVNFSRFPVLAWSGDDYGIAWQDYRDGKWDTWFAWLAPDGTLLQGETRVTFNGAWNSNYPAVAWSGSEFGVLYQDSRNGAAEMYFSRMVVDRDGDGLGDDAESAAGTMTNDWDTDGDGFGDGAEVLLGSNPVSASIVPGSFGTEMGDDLRVSNGLNDSINPVMSWSGRDFGLSWSDSRVGTAEIYFTRVSAAGVELGSDLRVTSDGSGGKYYPAMAWIGHQFGINWQDNRDANSEIYFGRVTLAGFKADLTDLRLTTDAATSTFPALVWTGSEFGTSWHDTRDGNSEIYFARFTSLGAKIGSDFRVSKAAGNSTYSSLVWTGSNFGVSWEDDRSGNYDLYLAFLPAAGSTVIMEIQVTTDTGISEYPSLAWTGSEFGLSWQDGRDGNREIYFNRVTNYGETAGPDVRVTNNSLISQQPSLAWAGSEYVLTWTDQRDSDYEIYFNRVSAGGTVMGSDLRVTTVVGSCSNPSLSWSGSEAGIAWQDNRDANNEIYFTRVGYQDPDGDGLLAAQETTAGTNANDWDTDNDGMDDGWEVAYSSCLFPTFGDSMGNPDSDSFPNLAEYGNSTDPCLYDGLTPNTNPVITNLPAAEPGHWGQFDMFFADAGDYDVPAQTITWSGSNNTCSFAPYIAQFSGMIEWTCPAAVETCAIDLTATDDGSPPLSDTETLTIECGNTTPVITSTPAPGATVGALYYYNILCSGGDGDELYMYLDATDTCGGVVTYFTAGSGSYEFIPGPAQGGDTCTVGVVCSDTVSSDTQSSPVLVAGCVDNDGDGYGDLCGPGPDCNDNNINAWNLCADCVDADGDNYYLMCDQYATVSGPDCDDGDENNWVNCAMCRDMDFDSYYDGCDAYVTIAGPDCGPYDENNWNSCATCLDGDTDTWFAGCDAYVTLTGPDCDDGSQNAWDTCATCADNDADTYYGTCNQYVGINGGDLDDANVNCWDLCMDCVDYDGDAYYFLCNQYLTVSGPDCDDDNTFAWDACATCVDGDTDTWYEDCNRYDSGARTLTLGGGTADWTYPLAAYYHDARTQVIYLASEIGQGGTITELALDVTVVPGQTLNNFTIRMKHTTMPYYDPAAWEGDTSGWTVVYQNDEGPGAIGWRAFTLSTPFAYSGTSNLLVDFSFNNSFYTTNGDVRSTDTGMPRSAVYQTDSAYGDPLLWAGSTMPEPMGSTSIPNLRITFDNVTIAGPDCDDSNRNAWDACATCDDDDGDSYFELCNQYVSVFGPDGDDTNVNCWDNCATCVDNDADTWYEYCDQYSTVSGPDCDDANINAWTSCGDCVDTDTDGYYFLCDQYATVSGPDCSDADQNNWVSCAMCVDNDFDTWYVECDAYATIDGPDCDDGNGSRNAGLPETLCDTIDNDCNAGTQDDKDDDLDTITYCQEILYGTTDSSPDSDADLMPDAWEILSGASCGMMPASGDSLNDQDGDGLANIGEYTSATDPCDNDSDNDFMPDGFEVLAGNSCGLDPLAADSTGDNDGDGLSNLNEHLFGTLPCAADSDGDFMPDGWEVDHACAGISPTANDAANDYDADGLNALGEYNAGTDPCDNDSDGDFMPDGFEVLAGNSCGLDVLTGDSSGDNDADGLSNLNEFFLSTLPCVADSEGDGMTDGWEIIYGSSCGIEPLIGDSLGDNDSDGLTNLAEYNLGANPCASDTDSDGMADGWESARPCLLLLESDAMGDPDTDGLTNLDEYSLGSNPCNPDTDGDGMGDGWENHQLCLDLLSGDSMFDGDADGLTNLVEYNLWSNPCWNDTDYDGMADGWEFDYSSCGLDLLTDDALQDGDSDGLTNLAEYGVFTNPCTPDSDEDGLTDGDEVNIHTTNPNHPDTDRDLMPDGWEVLYTLNPLADDANGDPDFDGLVNYNEYLAGTNPRDYDTDDDNLSDGYEYHIKGTDPLDPDSDDDGATDGREVNVLLTNPLNPDTDGDGMTDGWEGNYACVNELVPDASGDPDNDSVSNLDEFLAATNPCSDDSDGDGMKDSYENSHACLDPFTPDGSGDPDSDTITSLAEMTAGTDPCSADSDSDGLADGAEINTHHTNPLLADTDGDGLSDGDEVNTSLTDPLDPDSDDDGLNDGNEVNVYLTNPHAADTDGDGRNDGDEVTLGSNPAVANGVPVSSCSSPAYENGATVAVSFVNAAEPTALVKLYVSWNNSAFVDTGLSARGASGAIDYPAQYNEGAYRFYVRATFSPLRIEPAKSSAETTTVVDWTAPSSSCTSPAWAGSDFNVDFISNDAVATVHLWYRYEGGEWTDTTLVQNGSTGSFAFTAAPGTGTYEFYTIGSDPAENVETAPPGPDCVTEVDATPPDVSSMDVYFSGPYLIEGATVDIGWDEAVDPDSLVSYAYAIGTVAGGTDTLEYTALGYSCGAGSCQVTVTGAALPEGEIVYASVIAYNQGGMGAAPVSSAGALVDTVSPELVSSEPDSEDVILGDPTAIRIVIRDASSGINTALWPEVRLDSRDVTESADYDVTVDGNTMEIVFTSEGLSKLLEIVPGNKQGTHHVWVKAGDYAGTEILDRKIVFTIEKPGKVVIAPSVVDLPTNGEPVKFKAVGGSQPYTWSWSGGEVSAADGDSILYTPGPEPGSFLVSVVDSRGVSFSVPTTLSKVVFTIKPQAVGMEPGDTVLFQVEGGAPPYTWFALGGTIMIGTGPEFPYTAGWIFGEYKVSVMDSSTVPDIVSAKITISPDVGRAVIVAGGGILDDNRLVNSINYLGNFAYRTLISRGFTSDKIFYMNPNPTQPFDGNGDGYYNDIDAAPSLELLQYALTDWAAGGDTVLNGETLRAPDPVSADVPLTVILLDHGGVNQFLINRVLIGNTVEPVILPVSTLDLWLDQIQTAHPCRVQLVYDACFAGTFLDELANGPSGDRIVITSSTDDAPAFFTVNGTVSFSQFFFNNIMAGQDIKASYNLAAAAISNLAGQEPRLDDNGDGTFTESGPGRDGLASEGKHIGSVFFGGAETPSLLANPAISDLHLGDTVTIWADVVNYSDVSGIYAVITPPGYLPPVSAQDFNSPKLEDDLIPILPLTDPDEDGRYSYTISTEQALNIFTVNGDYIVTVYAKDIEDNISHPATTYISLVGMDIYEPDDDAGSASAIAIDDADGQLHNFHQALDEDWVMFSATVGLPYVAFTENLGPNCDTYMELYFLDGSTLELLDVNDDFFDLDSRIYFTAGATGTYYVMVAHSIGESGAGTDYLLHVDQDVGAFGSLEGHITDSVTGFGVYGAQVRVCYTPVNCLPPTVTIEGGFYEFVNVISPGTGYSFTVTKSNYNTSTGVSPQIIAGTIAVKNAALAPKTGVSTGILTGIVSGGGSPMGGVRVIINFSQVKTDVTGRYQVRLTPGSYPVSARADGYNDYNSIVPHPAVIASATTVHNITLTSSVADTDGDGLSDALEATMCTGVADPDSDDDGLCDGNTNVPAICAKGEDLDLNGVVDPGETDPCNANSDGDGLDDLGDCDPGDPNAWNTCATCNDDDGDTWFELCNAYSGISGPDCDDGDTLRNPGRSETLCDGKDNDCNGGTLDDPDNDADGLSYCNELIWGTSDADDDSDDDGISDGLEVNTYSTLPDDWDTDGDYLPDNFEITNMTGHTAGLELDPLDPGDGPAAFDGDTMPNNHEYWNGSNLWSDDPRPEPGFDVSCYFWGKADAGPYVQPSDITKIQMAYVGAALTYNLILPPAFDPLDLDRSTVPDPADIAIAQYMYTGSARPGGYVSSPISLSVLDAPVSAVAVGDTTHVTLSVHAQGPGTELYSPGIGVVFWVTSGNAVLLGGEGTDPGEAVGNRYDVSMRSADGAPANIVVLVTGPGPVSLSARIPSGGAPPFGRWNPEVNLAAPVVINP